MEYQLRSEIPAQDQFWTLFQTTNWNTNYKLKADEYMQALDASWYVISAYINERLVGFGRVVSDGIVHAMIFDLIVLPEFQELGIGTAILERLVSRCLDAHIRDIQLFCAVGKREFYERRGFQARPENAPGMQYLHPAGNKTLR